MRWLRFGRVVIFDVLVLIGAAVAIGLAAWALWRDGPPSPTPVAPPATFPDKVVEYRGAELHCIEFSASFAGDRSCDFVRFYAEHPELN